MAPQTWAVLVEHGVDSDVELELDFSFAAPDERAAEELVAYLRLETDYDVDVDFERVGGEVRDWAVVGSTHPTTFTEQIVVDWVRWMISVGAEYGGCQFEGWGAGVSD